MNHKIPAITTMLLVMFFSYAMLADASTSGSPSRVIGVRPMAATGAQLGLSPLNRTVNVGNVFTFDIVVTTGDRSADTVDAYLDFDPRYLQVVDGTGLAANRIEVNRDVFGDATYNTVDNQAGHIDFSASKYTAPSLIGTFTAATIRLRAKAMVIATDVVFVQQGARQSNVLRAGEALNPTFQKGNVSIVVSRSAVTSSALATWPTSGLIDGNAGTTWSSSGHVEHLVGAEWAVALLPSRSSVTRLRITPRQDPVNPTSSLGFPKDFVIQYAYEGDNRTCNAADPRFAQASNWRPLITRFGYDQPSSTPIDFTFQVVQAQCVRILGTELSQDDFGNRYMQFSELEVLGGQ